MSRVFPFIATFVFAAGSLSHAQSPKKCVDANGKITYTDQACAASSRTTTQIRITENVMDGSSDRASAQRILQEETEAAALQERQIRQLQSSKRSEINDDKNYKACVSEVENNRGLSNRQKADLLVRCQGAASTQLTTPVAKINECVSRINAMRGLSSRQQASALVGCRGGTPPSNENLQIPGNTGNKPTRITSCDPGGCWDDVGGRYSGTGQTLFTSTGKACQRVGSTLQCN
jgi:hypothetical protein